MLIRLDLSKYFNHDDIFMTHPGSYYLNLLSYLIYQYNKIYQINPDIGYIKAFGYPCYQIIGKFQGVEFISHRFDYFCFIGGIKDT